MRDERPLQQMEVSVAKPLGGDDLHVLMCDRRCQPAERAAPLQQDRAGAALPVIAALLHPGHAQPLPQRIQRRGPGVHGQAVLRTVHPERDLDTMISPEPSRSEWPSRTILIRYYKRGYPYDDCTCRPQRPGAVRSLYRTLTTRPGDSACGTPECA